MNAESPLPTDFAPSWTMPGRRPLRRARFVIDPARDRWSWSAEMFRIHGYPPGAVVPDADLTLQHADPGYRDALGRILAWCGSHEARAFVNHRTVVDASGRVHEVAVAGVPRRDGDGLAVGLNGVMFDFTGDDGEEADGVPGEESSVAEHLLVTIDELQGALVTRDVIGQAKGLLTATLGVDADAAFGLLTRTSQRTNRRLHDVARMVTHAAARGGPAVPPDIAAALEHGLRAL